MFSNCSLLKVGETTDSTVNNIIFTFPSGSERSIAQYMFYYTYGGNLNTPDPGFTYYWHE